MKGIYCRVIEPPVSTTYIGISRPISPSKQQWELSVKEERKRKAELERLQDMLFARGAMEDAPCFCCGYNGSGYFQPETHPCAERHHKLKAEEDVVGGFLPLRSK